MGAPREGLGALFRALVDFLEERRLRQQVDFLVSPEVASATPERTTVLYRVEW